MKGLCEFAKFPFFLFWVGKFHFPKYHLASFLVEAGTEQEKLFRNIHEFQSTTVSLCHKKTMHSYQTSNYPRGQQVFRERKGSKTLLELLIFALCFALPPLAVFMIEGFGGHFWFNILLTILGWWPGIIHALYILGSRRFSKKHRKSGLPPPTTFSNY